MIEQRIAMLSAQSAVSAGYKDPTFGEPPYNAFTVLRANFDRWFAQKAEEAGAFLLTGMPVDDVVRRDGQVVGVKTFDGSELLADIVIIADGVNSLLALKMGLRWRAEAERGGVAVKQVIRLTKETVESRFNISDGQGVVMEIMFGGIPRMRCLHGRLPLRQH